MNNILRLLSKERSSAMIYDNCYSKNNGILVTRVQGPVTKTEKSSLMYVKSLV